MITPSTIDRYAARYPAIPVLIYVAAVLTLVLNAVLVLIDIVDRYRAVDAATEILARLERRAPVASSEPDWQSAAPPPGSLFLEGDSITVASAALLERLTGAVARAGGNVASFEVEPERAESKEGYVKVIANCELNPESLQGLLYDIESGMPFLFVDQLVVQAPQPNDAGPRMRVLLGLSGMWSGAKQ
jgi:general secretion pathway protein M